MSLIAFDNKRTLHDWFVMNLTRLFSLLGATGAFIGKLTQAGTAAPTYTGIANTIAAITAALVWERTGVGAYRAPLPTGVDLTKFQAVPQGWHSVAAGVAKISDLSVGTDTGVKYLYFNLYELTLATGAIVAADVVTGAYFEFRMH